MKMLKKEAEQRQAVEMLCTDMLVPKGHLLRKIDAAVNFARIYDLVEDLYCEDNGRPSCDPVVLFKLVLIQHLFGIRSLRQTMRDAEVNVAYRWFLGYSMSQQLPHFATISYAFRHRFTAEVIEGVFRWILEEVAQAGYLSAEVVFVDGTHIKANANLKKQVKKAIPVAAKRYQEQLDEEIEADRAAHGKKPLKKDDDDDGLSAPGKQKIVAESTTDPESGVFHKGEHKKCFAYEAHTACDRRGYILETEITPGNVHDSVAFDTVFERLKAHYPEVQFVTADAGYKTPWICKQIFDSGKIPSLPYKRPMTKKGNLPWNAYVYDEYYDCILCPQNQVLSYATTNREGYKEYKSKGYICRDCPELEKCTQNRQHTKTVTRHIWQEYLERAEDIRHSPAGKVTYALRSQTIERVFADAKEKHAMRYTPYRGLAAAGRGFLVLCQFLLHPVKEVLGDNSGNAIRHHNVPVGVFSDIAAVAQKVLHAVVGHLLAPCILYTLLVEPVPDLGHSGSLVVTLECLPDKGSGERVKLETLVAVNQIADRTSTAVILGF